MTLQEYATQFYGERVNLGFDTDHFYVEFQDGSRLRCKASAETGFVLPDRNAEGGN